MSFSGLTGILSLKNFYALWWGKTWYLSWGWRDIGWDASCRTFRCLTSRFGSLQGRWAQNRRNSKEQQPGTLVTGHQYWVEEEGRCYFNLQTCNNEVSIFWTSPLTEMFFFIRQLLASTPLKNLFVRAVADVENTPRKTFWIQGCHAAIIRTAREATKHSKNQFWQAK